MRNARLSMTLFLLALWAPLLVQFAVPGGVHIAAIREGRKLAPLPSLGSTSLIEFPIAFDRWYEEHFGLRDIFIALNNSFRFLLFRVSPTKTVTVGKGGWFFLTAEMEGATRRSAPPFKDQELADLVRMYEARKRFVESAGGTYVLLIAPNKISVYPDAWPATVPHREGPTRLDQFMAAVAARSPGLPVVDLRPALLEARKSSDEPLFFQTDSHWNDLGAFLGYRYFMNYLRSAAPQYPLSIPELSHFKIVHKSSRGGGLNRMLGVLFPAKSTDPYLLGDEDPLLKNAQKESDKAEATVIKRPDDGTPRIPRGLVFRDSFFSRLVRYISPHFSELIVYSNKSRNFDPKLIVKYKANVVIDELVERNLRSPAPHDMENVRWMERQLPPADQPRGSSGERGRDDHRPFEPLRNSAK